MNAPNQNSEPRYLSWKTRAAMSTLFGVQIAYTAISTGAGFRQDYAEWMEEMSAEASGEVAPQDTSWRLLPELYADQDVGALIVCAILGVLAGCLSLFLLQAPITTRRNRWSLAVKLVLTTLASIYIAAAIGMLDFYSGH